MSSLAAGDAGLEERSEPRTSSAQDQLAQLIEENRTLRTELREARAAANWNATAAQAAPDSSFRALADSVDQMIWSTRPDGFHDYFNSRWYEFTGVPAGSTDGAGWNGIFHEDDQERAWDVWRSSLASGEPYHIEYRLRHRSGDYRWVLGRAQPVRAPSGEIIRWYGTCTDVHDLKVAEHALQERGRRLDVALDVARLSTFELNLSSGVLLLDPRGRQMMDLPADGDLLAHELLDRMRPADATSLSEVLEHDDPDNHSIEAELAFETRDGRSRVLLCAAHTTENGTRLFGVLSDVTGQRRAMANMRLMLNELNHRVKNTLATVQSIVAFTVRGDAGAASLREVLTARLMALSAAHNVLTQEQWAHADLLTIARETALPYQSGRQEQRFVIRGRPVHIPPAAAIGLSLALHELATNAAKYGALSTTAGRVELAWELVEMGERSLLKIRWQELNGPTVTPPQRRGFGTQLIERALAAEANSTIRVEYPPEGVVCSIELGLDLAQSGGARYRLSSGPGGWWLSDERGGERKFGSRELALAFVSRRLRALKQKGLGGSLVINRKEEP